MWIELDQPEALNAPRVGGKAAGLARLRQAGLPVRAGWCLPVEVEAYWLASADVTDLVRAIAEASNEQAWRRPAALLRARLAGVPPDVEGLPWTESLAVRSSARGEMAGFAGQLSTFLGIRGPDALRTAIHGCWLSRWSDSALRYAFGTGG